MQFDQSPANDLCPTLRGEQSNEDAYSLASPDSTYRNIFQGSDKKLALNLKEVTLVDKETPKGSKGISSFFGSDAFNQSLLPSIPTSNHFTRLTKSPSNVLNFSLSLTEKFQGSTDRADDFELIKKRSRLYSNEKETEVEEPCFSIKKKKGLGCTCSRSQCLRLHCKCFRELKYCSWQCGCNGCCNTPSFDTERMFVINSTKKINPNAFTSKIVQMESQQTVNSEGCRCKTGCKKKYCDCFRNGAGCSPICKCFDCKNQRVDLEPLAVREIFKPGWRSKDRVIVQPCFNSLEDLNSPPKDTQKSAEKFGSVQPNSVKKSVVVVFREFRKKHQDKDTHSRLCLS